MGVVPNEEIDLFQLVISVVKFLRKNSLIILLFSLAGILSLVAFDRTRPVIFQGSMILSSDILQEPPAKQITRNLNNIIQYPTETSTIFDSLKISREELAHIRYIDLDFVVEKFKEPENVKGLEKQNAIMIFTVQTATPNLLPKLQEAIILSFRRNHFVQTRVQQQRDYCQKMIQRINVEIRSFDSLKKTSISGKPGLVKTDAGIVSLPEINLTTLDLYKQQLQLKNRLTLVESIQLVEGFSPVTKIPARKLFLSILIGFALGFMLSIAYLVFRMILEHTKPTS
jgi:hypothetical protein